MAQTSRSWSKMAARPSTSMGLITSLLSLNVRLAWTCLPRGLQSFPDDAPCSEPRAVLGPYPITLVEVVRVVVLDLGLTCSLTSPERPKQPREDPWRSLAWRRRGRSPYKRLDERKEWRAPLRISIFIWLYFSLSGVNRALDRERRASASGQSGRATDGSFLLLNPLFRRTWDTLTR